VWRALAAANPSLSLEILMKIAVERLMPLRWLMEAKPSGGVVSRSIRQSYVLAIIDTSERLQGTPPSIRRRTRIGSMPEEI
jgi:hypothetical protein